MEFFVWLGMARQDLYDLAVPEGLIFPFSSIISSAYQIIFEHTLDHLDKMVNGTGTRELNGNNAIIGYSVPLVESTWQFYIGSSSPLSTRGRGIYIHITWSKAMAI